MTLFEAHALLKPIYSDKAKSMRVFITWRSRSTHDSAGYARVLQPFALKLGSKIAVTY